MKLKKLLKKTSEHSMIGLYNEGGYFINNFRTKRSIPESFYNSKVCCIWCGECEKSEMIVGKINITIKLEEETNE